MVIKIIKIPRHEPYNVKIIASYPSPLFKSSCPGKILSDVSSSGAPRSIEGIKSRKVCVVARETKNIRNVIGEINVKGKESRKIEIRFTCSPGIKPVIVPIIIPKINAKIEKNISNNINF